MFFNGTLFSTLLKKKSKRYNVDGSKLIAALNIKLKEKGYKIKEITQTGMIIDAPSSFWSWGEEMSVSVNNESQGCTVTVTSDAKYQLTDWGKSEENIDEIFSIIDDLVEG